MNKIILSLLALTVLCSCGNDGAPDVSNIKVNAAIARFDNDFFHADTLQVVPSMDGLARKYPYFFTDFIQHIVVAGGTDTSHEIPDLIKTYIAHSRPLYDSAQRQFAHLDQQEKELKKGFQYVHYYFPEYHIPQPVAYVGLIGDPAVALTRDALAVGLQMYLGKNFSAYNTPEAIDKFPQYISRRFEPQYVSVNCLQNIAQDIYPGNAQAQTLIEQIVEKGKQWWLADKFMPAVADSLKTGFTQVQLNWCRTNEGLVWNFLVQNYDIFTTEQPIIQNFLGEAPKTDGMPDASPGNIGQWVGWQIVKKYAASNGGSVKQVLQMDARKLFEASKYKPR